MYACKLLVIVCTDESYNVVGNDKRSKDIYRLRYRDENNVAAAENIDDVLACDSHRLSISPLPIYLSLKRRLRIGRILSLALVPLPLLLLLLLWIRHHYLSIHPVGTSSDDTPTCSPLMIVVLIRRSARTNDR